MSKKNILLMVCCVFFAIGTVEINAEEQSNQRLGTNTEDTITRPFYMGFTSWAYGPSDEDKKDSFAKDLKHGDMIGLHLDNGIPWPEALAGTAYHPNLDKELQEFAQNRPPDRVLYLAVVPLNNDRNGLALYRGEKGGMPLPEPWDALGFGDERVVAAYTNFCNDLITRLKPQFMNFGIEVLPGIATKKPELWPDFSVFLQKVYKGIKTAHPEVMTGISIGVDAPGSPDYIKTVEAYAEVRNTLDYVGLSTYPYAGPPWGPGDGDPSHLPNDWLSRFRDVAGDKPIAICETGFIGEDIKVPFLKWDIHGTPEWQAQYVEKLLKESKDLNMLFITWWTVADFDKLYETFTGWAADVGAIWRDTGLYDGKLNPRPALGVWDQWLAYPRERK